MKPEYKKYFIELRKRYHSYEVIDANQHFKLANIRTLDNYTFYQTYHRLLNGYTVWTGVYHIEPKDLGLMKLILKEREIQLQYQIEGGFPP